MITKTEKIQIFVDKEVKLAESVNTIQTNLKKDAKFTINDQKGEFQINRIFQLMIF
jgi:hypothetical protein